ncbi:hypothetical protein EXIGLDRAFT_699017 [Exidia glandulosa HHB12029]|uniref:Uncharacterized protein n=1 Tax=Exidia glandulosa HHB12029 TaxID=1314781 RepID=A0A165DZ65_EXIGL|nr:hypothetical protein EXIGLDRAFT_699017 [Exidia glandulosa HHB12029]
MSLDDPSSWAPNESAADLWFERGWLDGVFVGAVAYGVHATLFFITFCLLWERPRSGWRDYGWLLYIVVLFTVSSIGNAMQLKMAELGFIEYRNYPGPPGGWEAGNIYVVLCNAVYVVNTWLQDGLLLYRLRIIVGGSLLWMAFPAMVLAATVGVSCVLIYTMTRPGVLLWETLSANLLTAYFSLSVAYNLGITLAIVGRLLVVRYRVEKAISSTAPFIAVSAMLIESAALYTVFGVLSIIATGIRSSPLQNLVLPALSQVQSIAPMLIIMRVAQGRAWTADSSSSGTVSSVVFRRTEDDTHTRRHTYPLATLPIGTVRTHTSSIKLDSFRWTEDRSRDGDRADV